MSFIARCFRLMRRYAKYLVKDEGRKAGEPAGMQDYMERQLTELHYVAVNNEFPSKFIAFALTVLLAILLPYLHIGVLYMKLWAPDKPQIDRWGCTCSCFDTIFRGGYENPGMVTYKHVFFLILTGGYENPGMVTYKHVFFLILTGGYENPGMVTYKHVFFLIVTGGYENPGMVTYKHVYFNSTSSTLKIWIFTALFLLLFYESLRYLVFLVRSGAPLRRSMLLLYFVNLYPHYYSWWSFFSYYNEELYTYFNHHFVFTVTELIVTAIILSLCNRDNPVASWKIATIFTISLVHVIVSGMDQFIFHVLKGQGHSFQNVRDVGLMIPDLLHLLIPLRVFYQQAQRQKLRFIEMCYKEEIILMFVFISIGTILGRLI
ncbi:hypothetical protein V1264_010406 [Littorina saxatilis]|uniref:Uncharacterized protein n=1 Tax=Littorina saxatilis TaxID=31220 RepID=A0AAN9APN8_9CAEN